MYIDIRGAGDYLNRRKGGRYEGFTEHLVMDWKEIIVEVLITVLLTGPISGIVASLCYAGIKKKISPKIEIVPTLIVHPSEQEVIVKFINRGSMVTEIEANVIYYHINYTKATSRTLPAKYQIPFTVDKYVNDRDDTSSQSTYAVQLGFLYKDFLDVVDYSPNDRIIFSIKAVHPLSGTIKYISKEFRCDAENENNIVQDDSAEFLSGDNMGVVTHS